MDERALARASDSPVSDAVRETYLRHLLEQVESGSLPADEYAMKVQAVQEAGTVAEMADIVDAKDMEPKPALDPVDLLLMTRSAQTPKKTTNDSRRYYWIAAVVVFLVVLMVMGLWLVAHTKSVQNSGALSHHVWLATISAVVT